MYWERKLGTGLAILSFAAFTGAVVDARNWVIETQDKINNVIPDPISSAQLTAAREAKSSNAFPLAEMVLNGNPEAISVAVRIRSAELTINDYTSQQQRIIEISRETNPEIHLLGLTTTRHDLSEVGLISSGGVSGIFGILLLALVHRRRRLLASS